MNEHARQVMHECTRGSLDGSLTFPEVVSRLAAVGCEQYHADLRRQEKTHYLPNGENHVVPLPLEARTIARTFSADAVVAALRAIQQRQIRYPEFLTRILDAGCVGYYVFLAGKRAIYLGRNGDMHIEHFRPAAAATATD
jgi:uncharacterized protein YbcV (DUF1398 family)